MKRKTRNIWDKQFRVVSVDMFHVDVGVAVNMNQVEVERAVRKCCSSPDLLPPFLSELETWNDKTADCRMCLLGGGFVVLLRAKPDDLPGSVATLVHEMVHVTQYLLRHRRVPLNEDTEEVHAYLTEHLVRASLRVLS